jgi:uncharacterized protein (DUF4415 family)
VLQRRLPVPVSVGIVGAEQHDLGEVGSGRGEVLDVAHGPPVNGDEEVEAQMRIDPDWADLSNIDWSTAVAVYPIPKHAISIRLDRDVINFFKARGKGYQTRINAVLRHYMDEVKKKAGE